VGVNEFYTSKKCPVCQAFVGQVNTRRLYCPNCKSFMHRDELAGHNMCQIIQGHLLDQDRPRYLQPVYADGTLVWAQNKDKNDVKEQDQPECSIPKAPSEERGRLIAAKDASKDESQDSSQTRRALAKEDLHIRITLRQFPSQLAHSKYQLGQLEITIHQVDVILYSIYRFAQVEIL